MFSILLMVTGGYAHGADVVALNSFVETVAQAVEKRADEHGFDKALELVIETGRGVDPQQAKRFFRQELTAALGRSGRIVARRGGALKLTLTVSRRRDKIWVMGDLIDTENGKKIPIVVVGHRDSVLAAALGARRNYIGRRTWRATQVGKVAPGLLNFCLYPLENSPQGKGFAAVHVDGVRLYQMSPEGISPLGKEFLFKKEHRWPRVRKAWLAPRGEGQLEVSTSAGFTWLLDTRTGEWKRRKPGRAPLPQLGALGGSSVVTAVSQKGSATLSGPLREVAGEDLQGVPVGNTIRAAAKLGDDDQWIWIDGKGKLRRKLNGKVIELTSERVGDQLVVFDLDDSGQYEVVTTSARAMGEPDELVVRTLSRDGKTLKVLYQPSFQGSITALTVGITDYKELPTAWFVERDPDGKSWLWKLEAG